MYGRQAARRSKTQNVLPENCHPVRVVVWELITIFVLIWHFVKCTLLPLYLTLDALLIARQNVFIQVLHFVLQVFTATAHSFGCWSCCWWHSVVVLSSSSSHGRTHTYIWQIVCTVILFAVHFGHNYDVCKGLKCPGNLLVKLSKFTLFSFFHSDWKWKKCHLKLYTFQEHSCA